MNCPKISIITAVYNNKTTIEDTILSVISQTYKNIEYIVIDGNSTDGTLDVLNRYRFNFDIFISETDEGIYDALNKGLSMAHGDIIGFLHADDTFYSNKTLEIIATAFNNNFIIGVYGDLLYVDKENPSKIVRYWKSKPYKSSLLSKGWMPPHPTLFFDRKIVDEIGYFNTKYVIAADYDYLLRMLLHYPENDFCYLPVIITCMRTGGKSNRSLKNIINKSREDYEIIKDNKIGGINTLLNKNFSKISQFVKWKN
jgi:glycosyltransferase